LQNDVERSLVRRAAAGRVAGDSLRSGQTDRDRRHNTVSAGNHFNGDEPDRRDGGQARISDHRVSRPDAGHVLVGSVGA
jgi:hypothetical protein